MKFYRYLTHKLLFISVLVFSSFEACADVDLLKNGLKGWSEHKFVGKTKYTMAGRGIIRAISNGTASGIFYKQKIDLNKTPILSWKWKLKKAVKPKNEKSKAGDDFSARIYVVKSNKLLFWKTIVLNYVWASKAATGSHWDSPYTGNSKMIALGSGGALNTWQSAKVNIKQDFKRLFGRDIRYVDAIAIMTDTDNSKGSAEAYYSALRLSAK